MGLDFVIVVIGVGAAIITQQWLSNYQQRADMFLAETALQSDLFNNYDYAKERVAIIGCRMEALQAISEKLLVSGRVMLG